VNRLRAVLALRIRRVIWPFPALELQWPDGSGWLLLPLTTDLTTRPLVERDANAPRIPTA
jgi:hypothetical protein